MPAGVTAYVLSGNQDAVNYLRMKPAKKVPISMGGVEAKIYELRVLPPKPKSAETEGTPEAVSR